MAGGEIEAEAGDLRVEELLESAQGAAAPPPPRATWAEIIATAAGVTPGIRAASPTVRGRRRAHFSTTSRERPGSPA